ncbi:MAG: hypothetical protein KKI09_10660 [Spirochaetes bacterium]|nr:hypothetical protein [Spirochaetota bacterium]MBU0955879.1 hypothetical protein [Spirochaetota bacterium]
MSKRNPVFPILALLDLGRYFFLVSLLPLYLAGQDSMLFLRFVRMLASAQLLIPAALVFMWLDWRRYHSYLPLTLLAKILSLLTLAMLLPALLAARQPVSLLELAAVLTPPGIYMLAELLIASIMVYIQASPRFRIRPETEDQARDTDTREGQIETVAPAEAD